MSTNPRDNLKQNIRFSNLLHSISGGSYRNVIDETRDCNALDKLKHELANSKEFGFMKELLEQPVNEELLPEEEYYKKREDAINPEDLLSDTDDEDEDIDDEDDNLDSR